MHVVWTLGGLFVALAAALTVLDRVVARPVRTLIIYTRLNHRRLEALAEAVKWWLVEIGGPEAARHAREIDDAFGWTRQREAS